MDLPMTLNVGHPFVIYRLLSKGYCMRTESTTVVVSGVNWIGKFEASSPPWFLKEVVSLFRRRSRHVFFCSISCRVVFKKGP